MAGRRLRLVAGWSLLVGSFGILLDSYAEPLVDAGVPAWLETVIFPAGRASGSIGLAPAYLGTTLGLVCFVLVVYRVAGRWPAALAAIGITGTFVFWYSYPAHATFGGLGSIVLGTVVLLLPGWARFTSPVWVVSGTLGIPELVRPGIHWGPIASFSVLGLAVGLTGAYVLWGLPATVEEPPAVEHALAGS